ncbi:SnoaL-like domain-containing protein [Mycobacterium intermedium]
MTPLALRGDRLSLRHALFEGGDPRPEAFRVGALCVVEINPHGRLVTRVVFDPDDFDTAIAELDARYLVGEAAPHAHTWSVIAGSYAALNRREEPPTPPDLVSIDHRRVAAYAPGELIAYVRAGWDIGQQIRTFVERVHRINDLGAVVTHVAQGSSQAGFEAEWRGVDLLTVDGDMVNRSEVFDEDDIDAAIARFDQLSRPTPRLENAASRVGERLFSWFGTRNWDAIAQILADDVFADDRRLAANAGPRRGRDAQIQDLQGLAGVGFANLTPTVIATRGERLALIRLQLSGNDPNAFRLEGFHLLELDADQRIAAGVLFELDDFEAAIAELDARYLAGEAAPHARTWSVVAESYAALSRHELPGTPDFASIDHRRGRSYEPGDMPAYVRATWDLAPHSKIYVEAVHRLSDLGAAVTQASYGTSLEGFDAEWREIAVVMVDGDLVNRSELFDEEDIDAALARFDQLSPPAPRLENAASRVYERLAACYRARDWGGIATALVDNISAEDRRRVVNSALLQGKDAVFKNMRVSADVGVMRFTPTIIATRGHRLALSRTRYWGQVDEPGAYLSDVLHLITIDVDERIATLISFDLDDIDAALEELDARYLAGEAAAQANAWSLLTRVQNAYNRHEVTPTTTDGFVNIDHRQGRAFIPGDLIPFLRATWNVASNVKGYIENVHRLNNFGAVITEVVTGTSQDGFDFELREIGLFVFEGDLVCRFELFDEADLDAALARFDELRSQTRPPENEASKVAERVMAHYAAQDWNSIAEILSDNHYLDDRRRVVNAGIRHGRDAEIANIQAAIDLGATNVTSVLMATRGTRLALTRTRFSGRDRRPEALHTEVLNIVELDADERVAALVSFDLDDVDAAFAELDSRYLAGEAAAHAHTWSVIAAAYAAMNRHELPATTPDWVNIDNRRTTAFAPGDAIASLRAMWGLAPDFAIHIETLHRLNNLGAVFTQAASGTSHQGFEAEWRSVGILTVGGGLIDHCELFDEADIDAALTRFDQLSPPARRLENTTSQVAQRFLAHFAALDWDVIAETLADDFCQDDRRRVVGAGVRRGRGAQIEDMRATAELGIMSVTPTSIALRGERLALMRVGFSFRDQGPRAFDVERLSVYEINADDRIVAIVAFGPDDIDAAFQELDTRYVAGEAAPHAHTWSVITQVYAALNRQELAATTQGWVNIDHRRGTKFAAGEITTYLRATWDVMAQASIYVESVHRLSDLGVVLTHVASGTSQDGFDAEWREIAIMTVEGDLLSRCEIFDEGDLDTALARFEELHPEAPRVENAATRAQVGFFVNFAARNWAAIAETLSEDSVIDDRHDVVNVGFWDGRDAVIENLRALSEAGENTTLSVIATRGERLALTRMTSLSREPRYGEFRSEMLMVVEIDCDGRIGAQVSFAPNDFESAFGELDTRYLVGEAAPNARTWSVITGAHAAFNRRELPATIPGGPVYIDRRPVVSIEGVELAATVHAVWDLTPDATVYVEAVHRLSKTEAVITQALTGTSQEGFNAEWRMVEVFTVEGDLLSRVEIFEEADIDAALARFEELQALRRRLENPASRLLERSFAYAAAGDWAAVADTWADDIFSDDRRRAVNFGQTHGRDPVVANLRRAFDLGDELVISEPIAARGRRLVLNRLRWSAKDQGPEAFPSESLCITELNSDERIAASIMFDFDDFDSALEELDARYLAGEAATHAHMWSVIAEGHAGFNRQETAATTPDVVYIDHRPVVSLEGVELAATQRAVWDLTPETNAYVETVHRLSELGAVITQVVTGTSQEGFAAEWRMIAVCTVEGDLLSRYEVFDDADLEAALARFNDLHPQTRPLENAAAQTLQRYQACFSARDWIAFGDLLADKIVVDDRRRVVNAGMRRGRDVHVADVRAAVEVGSETITSSAVATRGERLILARVRFRNRDYGPDEFGADIVGVVEIGADDRISAIVSFDPDDVDRAFEELDARYLAGEAAAHPHVWAVMARECAAFNSHDHPAADWEIVDHRHLAIIEATDPQATQAIWDVTPDLVIRIEAVPRLSSFGAVGIYAAGGTSPDGVGAEWRMILLLTIAGDRIIRCEVFDEAGLDDALASPDFS